MPKDLVYGQQAREAIIEGVDFLADAVKVTLGPKGRNVAISRRLLGLRPLITKDGVTVANHVDPASPRQQIGSDLAREAANRCVHATGDGTTTTTVLVQGMVHAGANFIARGIDPWSLKRGIDKAAALVIEQLEAIARPVETPEQTFDVANISSNGDEAIATMVCDAFKQVGIDGAVTVEESGTALTELGVTSGIQFRSGEFLSASFANDLERFEAVYDDALILLFEGRIGTAKSLAPLLAQVAKQRKPLLCIAGDWEQDALALLVVNRMKANAPLVAVKTGAYTERRKDLLRDIAALTGGTAILDDSGIKIESVTLAQLGQAKRIVVSDKDCTIVDGYGPAEDVAARVGEIRTKLETAEGVNKLWLERRLAQLTGGIAVIKVGGNTETEMREKKDRFDDAVGATRAAIERGLGPACGSAAATGSVEGNDTSAVIGTTPCGNTLTNNFWQVQWSGFSLPSYVAAANITAVYAVSVNGYGPYVGGTVFASVTCTGPSNSVNLLGSGSWPVQQFNGALTGTWTSGQIAATTCQANLNYSSFGGAGTDTTLNVSVIGLQIYYTGTAPPTNNNINMDYPLQFSLGNLSIDPNATFRAWNLLTYTVSTLPAAQTAYNTIVPVTDGTSSTDCTTGGGSDFVLCKSNRTSWTAVTVGGGGPGITQLTGDGTAGPGSGSQTLTLATVNGGPGSCGDSTHVCQVTTNGKGLVTAQTAVAISGGGGGGTVSAICPSGSYPNAQCALYPNSSSPGTSLNYSVCSSALFEIEPGLLSKSELPLF
jgi:chaperonin GroEL